MLGVNDGETIPAKERPQRSQRWTGEDAWAAYQLPFNDLLFRSQSVHREHFDPNRVQLSRLLNIKTGVVRKTAVTAASRRIMRQLLQPPS